MRRNILLGTVLLIATGYFLDYGFKGMNTDSDFSYIGGILGIVFWIFLALFIWEKGRTKEKKHEESNVAVGTSDSSVSGSGLHEPDRTGDGGNRS